MRKSKIEEIITSLKEVINRIEKDTHIEILETCVDLRNKLKNEAIDSVIFPVGISVFDEVVEIKKEFSHLENLRVTVLSDFFLRDGVLLIPQDMLNNEGILRKLVI